MELINNTGFPAEKEPGALSDEEMIVTVALKATCRLRDGKLVAVGDDESWPVFTGPMEMNGAEFDGEMHYARGMVDVHVLGTAHAPGGEPVREMQVEVGSGEMNYQLDVIGDRTWELDVDGGLSPSHPEEFIKMPLGNDRAFGGKGELEGIETSFPSNPAGRGFYPERKQAAGGALPNVERPDDRVRKWDDLPIPGCLLNAPASSLGLEKEFVFDDDGTMVATTPYLFQQAVPDLVAPAESLGAELTLRGFSPHGDIVYPLPGADDLPKIEVQSGSRRSEFRMPLSSLVVLADEEALVLTFKRSFRYLLDEEGYVTKGEVVWESDWIEREKDGEQEAAAGVTQKSSALPQPAAPEPGPTEPEPEPPASASYVFEAQPDPEAPKQLFVTVRRTYELGADGTLRLAEEQLPLPEEREDYDDVPEGVIPSCKVMPEGIFKNRTDIILLGSAHTYGSPGSSLVAGLTVGDHARRARVIGKRVCGIRGDRIVFSDPEPFETVPLRYEEAYGGRDAWAEKTFLDAIDGDAKQKFAPFLPPGAERASPFIYPRNPSGKGFVVCEDLEPIDGRELPRLEDPDDLLTPERLVCGGLHRWVQQPLPIGFGPVDPCWFPRIAMLGNCPVYQPEDSRFPEIERGLLPKDFIRPNVLELPTSRFAEALHPLASQAASLGLWVPYLRGNEPVTLQNIHPERPDFAFRLPGERPRLKVRFRGQDHEPPAELYTLILEPEEGLVSLVWGGGVPLDRPSHPTEIDAAETTVTWDSK